MKGDLLARIYRAFARPLILLAGVMLVGTAGFMYFGGPKYSVLDALYMMWLTTFTVGYGEIVDLEKSPAGRVFNMIVATIGMGMIAYLWARLAAFIVESDIDQLWRRRRMLERISKISGHYIICGVGRVGTNVLRELVSTGRESVVIEPSTQVLEEMRKNYPRQLFLQGDGASDEMLLAAGIERAVGVFAVSGDDGKNLVISLSARQLNSRLRIVARCHDVGFVDKIRRVGADDIVSPDFTGALRIASSMLRPAVVGFLDEMLRSDQGLRVEEVAVPQSAADRRLSELAPSDEHYIVLALRHEGHWEFNPRNDRWARAGDTLVVMTTPEGRAKLERLAAA